jgi:hypothetical protein
MDGEGDLLREWPEFAVSGEEGRSWMFAVQQTRRRKRCNTFAAGGELRGSRV